MEGFCGGVIAAPATAPAVSCGPSGTSSNRTYKANSLPDQRLDQPLFVTIVTDRGPRRIEPRRQVRFRDNAAIPDGVDDLIPADDALALPDQESQKVEDLRLELNQRCSLAKLAPLSVQLKPIKLVAQSVKPQFRRGIKAIARSLGEGIPLGRNRRSRVKRRCGFSG